MTTQHTQGRLIVTSKYTLCTDDGETPVASTFLIDSVSQNDGANARRLVACWNACEGISTEALERGPLPAEAFQREQNRADLAERECDKLLNDLRPLITKRMGAEQIREGIQRAIARAAIAKVEGKV